MEPGVQARRRTSPRFVWATSWYRPYMSAWGIWSKLCDSNALTAPSAKVLLEEVGLNGSVFRARSSDPWLLHASTLSTQQRDDACCVARFHPSAVEAKVLRFCRVCMEQGFHCGCFQHLALTRCPVHDLPLENRCRRCGAYVLVTFEMARTAVFACRSCEAQLVWPGTAFRHEPANDAIWRATITSLTWDAGSTPARVHRDRDTIEAGSSSWWGGPDPFVDASTWRPKRTTVPDGGENFNELAWRTYLAHVFACVGTSALPDVLNVAECLLARRALPSRAMTLSTQQWAAACLIARYGGPAAFERARRLSLVAAPNVAYWLFPQASPTVLASAVGNAVIVSAELQAVLGRALRKIQRKGIEVLPRDELTVHDCQVRWEVRPVGGGRLSLQWRAPGIHASVYRRGADINLATS